MAAVPKLGGLLLQGWGSAEPCLPLAEGLLQQPQPCWSQVFGYSK